MIKTKSDTSKLKAENGKLDKKVQAQGRKISQLTKERDAARLELDTLKAKIVSDAEEAAKVAGAAK